MGKMNNGLVLGIALHIAKELGVNNLEIDNEKKFQLETVIKKLKEMWLQMSPEDAYADIYKTICILLQMWNRKEI